MAKLNQLPDFYLVGAPRSGTTALSKYLNNHSKICFSRPKEPHFFTFHPAAHDDSKLQSDYLDRYFLEYDPDAHTHVGEGSVSYLYSEDAIQRIYRLNPRARFIVHVRNPLQMVPSHHARLLYILDEDEPDFAKAWRLQDRRERGERVPSTCRSIDMLRYRDFGMLGQHLSRLYELVGRERCHVNVFDDFLEDPAQVYARTLEFLGLDHDGRTNFPVAQPSRVYRYRLLHRLIYRPGPSGEKLMLEVQQKDALRKASGDDTKKGRPLLKRVHEKIKLWNSERGQIEPLQGSIRDELVEAYAPDVEHLSKLLDRDLRSWLKS